jgi:hypothetical protein
MKESNSTCSGLMTTRRLPSYLNGAATPWHQDEAFRDPAYDYAEITIWMPLQAVERRLTRRRLTACAA